MVLRDWPSTSCQQMSAYENCLLCYEYESEWIAFLDADEFLFHTEKDDLKQVLEDFSNVSGVVVNVIYFGSSGHQTRPSGLQIENYIKRAATEYRYNRYVKSIVRPLEILYPASPNHFYPLKEDAFIVTENHEPMQEAESEMISIQHLRINHYYTRSKQEMKQKALKGDAMFPWKKSLNSLELSDANLNEVEDLTIQRFLPQLKQAVNTVVESSTVVQLLIEKSKLETDLYKKQEDLEQVQLKCQQTEEKLNLS
ncbi:glycosyltransferase family 92 protein, partial [Planktothrix sp.]|uniref:glycosyltransferase family 92 protein n=1 Tax=Planktothrix sp. TaxID=3088171 RepID=UPI0038D4AD92